MSSFRVLSFSLVVSLLATTVSPLALAAEKKDGAVSSTERMTRLDETLSDIRKEQKVVRLVGGISSIVFGGALITIGALSSSTTNGLPLYVGGGLFAGVGVVLLLVPGKIEKKLNEYSLLGDKTLEEKKIKLTKGEFLLEDIAGDAYQMRIWGGVTNAVLGGLFLFLSNQYAGGTTGTTYIVCGSILLGTALFNFLVKTKYERKWESYKEWRDGQKAAQVEDLSPSIDFGVMPLSNDGLAGAVQLRF